MKYQQAERPETNPSESETMVFLKARLDPEFSTWRQRAFEMSERPTTPAWFRETLLCLFLGLSVPLPPKQAFFFRFFCKKLSGWPSESSLPKKEDRWGYQQHLPVVYERVPKEAEPAMKEAVVELIDMMAKAGVFDEMEEPKR